MIYVNSIQVIFIPVVLILCIHYYFKFIVVMENFSVNKLNPNFMPLENSLAINDDLSKSEILFDKDGVISSAKLKDHIYFGTINGQVLKYDFSKKKLDLIIQFNAKITSIRPSEDNNLYLLSVCTGIFKLDLSTRQLSIIYDHRSLANKLNPSNATHLSDFLVLNTNGKQSFLIAQSSRRWTSRKNFISHIEGDKSGQIIEYIPESNQVNLIVQNLGFPKSLELSDDKNSVFVTEFVSRKIIKLYLNSLKKNSVETLIDNLPGEPNHIRRSLSKDETYWVSVNGARNSNNYGKLDKISQNVVVREILLYIIKGVEDFFLLIEKLVDSNYYIAKWNNYVLDWYLNDYNHGLVFEISKNGNILKSLQSPNGKISNIEEINEFLIENKKKLVLSSAFNKYVALLN